MAAKASISIPVLAGSVLLVTTYVAYPFLTLYRLDSAVERRDAKALRRLIDWPMVREGIESDLAAPRDELAPFGAAFLRTVAIKAAVTPEAVLAALNAKSGHAEGQAISGRLHGAWLEGPSRLVLDLGTVRLRMELRHGAWEVTRAWLPPEVLAQARAEAGSSQSGGVAQLSSSASQ